MVPVLCSAHIGCCGAEPASSQTCHHAAPTGSPPGPICRPRAVLLGFTWENIPAFVHKDYQCLRACVSACVLGGEGEGERAGGGARCSIHQNARIVFSHGGAASRACRGRRGSRAQARSARTASSDQYGLMPFFLVRLESSCELSAEPVQSSMMFP